MKLAVIADIHGNRPALAAVLADLQARTPDVVVNLGDACNGPIDPAGTASLLRALPAHHVRGNGDRMVGAPPEKDISASARFARERLSAENRAWLGGWPAVAQGDGWLACHGSPRSDTEYLLEQVGATGVSARSAAGVAAILGPGKPGLVLCGHTHLPRVLALPDERLVVNPGSVGLPAYDDDQPYPHKIETGSPLARYAIVERTAAGWRAELIGAAYDWEGSAALADGYGWPAWARAVRTGFV